MQQLENSVRKLARSQAPVYILVNPVAVKSLRSGLFTNWGPARTNLFVPVNCGAIPKELMEVNFHTKRLFTGAHVDKTGLFKAADGGTLFWTKWLIYLWICRLNSPGPFRKSDTGGGWLPRGNH